MSGKTTVTSIIGEEYKTWERAVIIDAGTGAGKTYFIINVLIPYERSLNKRVLFLCNRKYLYNQIRPLIEKYPGADLTLYQMLKSWVGEEIKNKKYDIIVVDESHYFLSDSEYNEYTSDDFDYVTSQKDNQSYYQLMDSD